MPKKVSETRTDALLAKAQAKIRVLNLYIEKELPDQEGGDAPVYFPESATKFAEWENEILALEAFNAPNWRKKIDPQQYRAEDKRRLKIESEQLIKVLLDFKLARGKKGQRLDKLKSKCRFAEDMNKSLSSQLQQLHCQVKRLQRDKAQLEARLEDSYEDLAALRQKLSGKGKVVSIIGSQDYGE